MRTEIKIHSSKVLIPYTENTSIDEAWNLWTLAVREKNKERKQLYNDREKLLLDYGNQSRTSDNLQELKKLLINVKGFRDIVLSSKNWNKNELVCSDNLGNSLFLESYEERSYEEREKEVNSLIDTIKTKIERLSQEPKPDQNRNHNSQEPEQIYPYIKYVSREEIKSILSNLEAAKFKETNKQTFAAVAKIIYDKDIINKRKCTNFKKWLNVFSKYYERKTSVYKPNQLKTATEKAIVQYPFLEHDYKGSLQKGNLI